MTSDGHPGDVADSAPMTETVWQGSEGLEALLVPIDTHVPSPGNPRRGDTAAVAGSLLRFGQLKPIVVDGSRIVAGHHVVMAAREAGWTHVAALPHEFGSEDEQRAFLLADNRTSDLGSYDDRDLIAQLQTLADLGTFDGTGYGAEDLDALMESLRVSEAEAERQRLLEERVGREDDVPPVPQVAKSQPGWVYELGPHRLMCGDARTDLATLVGTATIELLWTDPPYGVEYVGKTKRALTIENDDGDDLRSFLTECFQRVDEVLSPGCRFYVAAPPGPRHLDFLLAIEPTNWSLHETLVWVKDVFVLGQAPAGTAITPRTPCSRWHGRREAKSTRR